MNDKKIVIMGLLILVVAMFLTNIWNRPTGYQVSGTGTEVRAWPTQINFGDTVTITVTPGSNGVSNYGADGQGVAVECDGDRVQASRENLCGKQSVCEPGQTYTRSYVILEGRWPTGTCRAWVEDKGTGKVLSNPFSIG